jgi:glucose/mannose-6-phosphate isomerase
VPFEIFTEFHIPYYAGPKSLVVLSSYSGNTEETINALHMAISQNTKVFGITAGGKMAEILKKEELPSYIFEPKNNPSGQPRMSLGYASGAVLGLISKLGLAHITNDEIQKTVEVMRKVIKDLDEDVPEDKNEAKHFAKKINGRMPVLVASEHLIGSAHALKNQLNESAKTFATLFDLPELNHHLMEGLARPAKAKELLYFIFFTSKLYPDRVQIRYPLTAEVVEKNDVGYSTYPLKTETKLEQVFELLTFGSLMVYYLSKSLQIDPMVIPWVDYFKEKLAK